MYIARFELDGQPLATTALSIPSDAETLLPRPWHEMLLGRRSPGFGLRLRFQGDRIERLLLLSGQKSEQVRQVVETLVDAAPLVVRDAADFDAATDTPESQLYLQHGNYRVGERTLAADFRLFPLIEHLERIPALRDASWFYQCNLHPLPVEPERVRAARKWKAAMQLENELPAKLLQMQSALSDRLLEPAFSCDEFLAMPSIEASQAAFEEIREHFSETQGRLGFTAPPLELEDHAEALLTGLSVRHLEGPPDLPTLAANALPSADARRFLSLRPGRATGRTPNSTSSTSTTPLGTDVFVSYSSTDFANAWTTCQHLENNGFSCWIAPRNIPFGGSYATWIEKGLDHAKVLVIVLSRASNLSEHVHREVDGALERGLVVIPLRIQEVEPDNDLRYLLRLKQWVNAFESFEQGLELLLARVRDELAH